jgi:hypothetical protein
MFCTCPATMVMQRNRTLVSGKAEAAAYRHDDHMRRWRAVISQFMAMLRQWFKA